MNFVKVPLVFAIPWILLVFKCSVHETCNSGKLSMTPDDPFAFVNSYIELCCETATPSLPGREAIIIFQCKNTPDMYGRMKAPQLVCANISVTSTDQIGMCYCRDQHGCYHWKLLEIDVPLATIMATCTASYREEHRIMTCSWPVPDFRHPELVSTRVRWSPGNNCSGKEEHATCQRINECTVTVTDLVQNDCFMNVSFEMTYTLEGSSSPQQFISSPYWNFDIHSVVKISPVTNLMILNSTSTCVTLGWSVSDDEITSWAVSDKEAEYYVNVTFQSEWKASSEIMLIQGKNMHLLCHLRAFTWYTIYVTVRLSSSNVWSDSVQIKTQTLADVPQCGPEVTPGAFDILNTQLSRSGKEAVIYWKEPTTTEWQSKTDLGYYVYTKTDKENDWHNTSLDKSLKSVTNWIIPLQNEAITFVKIFSKNNIGKANCSATEIVIKDSKNILLLDVLASWRNGTVQISWNKQRVNSRSTVFWCERSEQQDICNNAINWTTVNNLNATTIFLSFPISEAQVYQYGVSLEDVDSKQHSEIMWTSCLTAYKDSDQNVQYFGVCPQKAASLPDLQRLWPPIVSTLFIIVIIACCIRKCYKYKERIRKRFLTEDGGSTGSSSSKNLIKKQDSSGSSCQGDRTVSENSFHKEPSGSGSSHQSETAVSSLNSTGASSSGASSSDTLHIGNPSQISKNISSQTEDPPSGPDYLIVVYISSGNSPQSRATQDHRVKNDPPYIANR